MIRKEGSDYVAEVHGAISIANSLAYVSECIDPISVFIGFTQRDLMTQAVRFILLARARPDSCSIRSFCGIGIRPAPGDVHPLSFLMSD